MVHRASRAGGNLSNTLHTCQTGHVIVFCLLVQLTLALAGLPAIQSVPSEALEEQVVG